MPSLLPHYLTIASTQRKSDAQPSSVPYNVIFETAQRAPIRVHPFPHSQNPQERDYEDSSNHCQRHAKFQCTNDPRPPVTAISASQIPLPTESFSAKVVLKVPRDLWWKREYLLPVAQSRSHCSFLERAWLSKMLQLRLWVSIRGTKEEVIRSQDCALGIWRVREAVAFERGQSKRQKTNEHQIYAMHSLIQTGLENQCSMSHITVRSSSP